MILSCILVTELNMYLIFLNHFYCGLAKSGIFVCMIDSLVLSIKLHMQYIFVHILNFTCFVICYHFVSLSYSLFFQVDLKTTAKCEAVWQGNALSTRAGKVTCKSLKNAPIK
jgi:hypothetical protein